MKTVTAHELDRFRDGRWRLMVVTEVGGIPIIGKVNGVVETGEMRFDPGDVTLADEHDESIFPPISLARANDLARRILDGTDARAATDSRSALILAAVLMALQTDAPCPQPSEPAEDVLAVPSVTGA